MTNADKEALKIIAEDETESKLFRSVAWRTLGGLKLLDEELEEAVHFFRWALDVNEMARLSEQGRRVVMVGSVTSKGRKKSTIFFSRCPSLSR